MSSTLRLSLVLFAFSLAACSGRSTRPPQDGSVPTDGSSPSDGGPGIDFGPGHDAGPGVDAGTPDTVDPTCLDGMYSETLPDPHASLSGLSYTGDIPGFVDAALGRRYPFGQMQVAGGRMDSSFGDCAVVFAGSPTSAGDVYRSLDTIVHECGHLNDGRMGSGATNAYVINPATTFSCTRGDAMDRGGDTFARSLITGDSYASARPECPSGSFSPGCDPYRSIYLNGNPTDGTFDSGDQGYNLLLEEAVQYINSLATGYAYQDQLGGGSTSDRDGILTFLWYVERYLHLARASYPAAYMRIANDMCWRRATLTVWGRAWLYLQTTRGMRALGIDDAAIDTLVRDPALLDEIQRLRALEGC